MSPHKANVLLKVSDQGPGILRKNLDRIFDPFSTTNRLERETGLGLSTAYGIAKKHEGEIAVESHENKESRFFVYLPAADTGAAEPAEKINPAVNVLLSSGFSIAGQAEELLDGGCRGFILKPYEINQLALKVMDILSAQETPRKDKTGSVGREKRHRAIS